MAGLFIESGIPCRVRLKYRPPARRSSPGPLSLGRRRCARRARRERQLSRTQHRCLSERVCQGDDRGRRGEREVATVAQAIRPDDSHQRVLGNGQRSPDGGRSRAQRARRRRPRVRDDPADRRIAGQCLRENEIDGAAGGVEQSSGIGRGRPSAVASQPGGDVECNNRTASASSAARTGATSESLR